MKIAILFPNTETSRFLGIKLLESGYEVVFFCPDTLDVDLAQNMIFECNMVGMEQDNLRETEKSFTVERFDVSDCNVIGKDLLLLRRSISIFVILVIPWLDIQDKKDEDYSDMCFNLFR